MRENDRIAVLGGGVWGTVLAHHLSRGSGREVRLWEILAEAAGALSKSRRHPHVPGLRLDGGVRVVCDLGAAADGAQVLIVAVPSQFVRRTARRLRRFIALGDAPAIISVSKGVEPRTLKTMGEVIASELPGCPVYTLSGPSFAKEVARGVPTKLVLAGPRPARARGLLRLLTTDTLRVSFSPDRKGVELGGSLKNVMAVACGILDGLGAGSNTKAALMVQGLSEMGELIVRCGGRRETIYGLSGLGDLIATGTSAQSRNRAFGEKLGRGASASRARREIPTVVEGVEAAWSAHALARRHGLRTPLLDSIWRAVHHGGSPKEVLRAMEFNS